MRALLYQGIGKLELLELPEPSNEIILEVRKVGICGTDLKAYLRGHPLFAPPTILGHECYGRIKSSSVEVFREGELVVVAPYAECGRCWRCRKGLGELCRDKTHLNSGCFVEYIGLSREEASRLLFKAEEEKTALVLAEPLACVLESLKEEGIREALIVGGGPMGALFAIYFKLRGIDALIVEKAPWRANYLRQMGFDVSISLDDGKERYDAVILCVDNPGLVERLLPFVEDGGTLLLFAGLPKGKEIKLDPYHVHYREVQIRGSFGYKINTFKQALNEVRAHSNEYEKVITHSFPLEEFEEAFNLLQRRESLKIVFEVR